MQHDCIGTLARVRRLAKRWAAFFLVLLDDDALDERVPTTPRLTDAVNDAFVSLNDSNASFMAAHDAPHFLTHQ